ncbi:MAG: hypothetical protein LUE22_03090 [Oscillospiraceae bacterium]|nr:hypothetical protein [Oscillospiraceae bacterium]
MDVKEFLSHLDGVLGSGGQYTARCPAHQDAHKKYYYERKNNAESN